MSNAVAKVSFLQGQAWAKAPDGSLRVLMVGSTLNDDEILVTAQGARIELDVGTGDPLVVNGGQEVGMSRDFVADTATAADEALLSDASVQEALTVLDQGGDLLEELEAAAAGNAGGGGGDGHDFVQLTRIIENTDPLAFDFSQASQAGLGGVEDDADYINRAPLVTDQVIALNEDEPLTGQIIATDIENDALTFTLTVPPVNGTLALDPATGQFIFTPNANYNGSDGFVVTVTDSRGNSTTTSITLNIAPVNDAPTTNAIALTTNEDVPVSGQVVAQDIENNTLSYVVSGQPTNGTVALNPTTGGFLYTPNSNYNGSDSFVVTVSDGNGGTTTSTVTIGVTPVNDAPVSSNQNLTTAEDTAISGQITANDVDGDILGYLVSGQPSNGIVTLNPATGGFIYTPNSNYNGSDRFVVTISDGKGGTTTSTVNIGVTPVNDAPMSSNQNLTTAEDTAISGQITASDVDGDTLGYVVSGQPTNGTVALNPTTGGFIYTPNSNYNGSDSFVVIVSDGKGGTTTSTVNIGVTPVNDAPVASNQNLTTPEDTVLGGQISASDIDGDGLSYAVLVLPTQGSLFFNTVTGSFVYVPNAGYNGSDSFVVTISDGKGGTTTSTVNIGVTPVNDAPVASNLNLTTDENIEVNGAISANDPDGDTLTYILSGNPANGSVTLNSATGTFVYTPNTGYTGDDSFVVIISDGNGGTTTSTVTIGVAPSNNAPVVDNQKLTTDEGVELPGSVGGNDPDGDTISYSLLSAPSNGVLTLDIVTGKFTYTPNSGYVGGDSFTVTLSDGNGGTTNSVITIDVKDVNAAPVANDDTATVTEGDSVTIAVRGNDTDPESDSLVVSGITQGANGSVIIDPVTGNPIYTPNSGFKGEDTFTYTINDGNGNGNSDTATVTVQVTAANQPSVMNPESITIDEDTSLLSNVLSNDTDSDDTLQIASFEVNGNTYLAGTNAILAGVGEITIFTNGDYRFDPEPNYNGSVPVITYTTNTGSSSTLTITVDPVNDRPVANDDTVTTNEDTAVTIAVRGNDTDPEGDSLTVSAVTQGTHGSVAIDPVTGNPVYTPNAGFSGSDSFTYTVTDRYLGGGTATATVYLTVNAVIPANQAPETTPVKATGNEDTLVTINLAGTDTDGTVAGFIIKSLPANGVLYSDELMTTEVLAGDLVSGPVYFMPNADWNGSTNFTYAARDNDGLTDITEAQANIIVTPESDDAELGIGEGAVQEDTPSQITAKGTLSIVDLDEGEAYFEEQSDVAGTYGTFSINRDGEWTYTLDNSKPEVQQLKEGESKAELFVVTSLDGSTTSVMVTVYGTNDGPTAVADSGTTLRNNALTFTPAELLGNDTDPDLDTLTIDSVQGAVNGNVTIVGGNVVFVPTTGYHGSASFTYTIIDGKGGSSTATVNLTVVKPNAAPVAVDDPAFVQLNAGGTQGWAQSFIKSITATGGTLTLNNADGVAGAIGVAGAGSTTEVDDEIQSGESLTLTFDAPVLDASFGFAKLDFSGTPEIGLWIAYLDGVEVSRGQFQPADATRAGTVQIKDATGNFIAFDQIRFDTASVGADYVVTSFAAVRTTAMTTEGGSIQKTATGGVLANDTDADAGDTLSVTAVRTGTELDTGVAGTIGVALQGIYGRLTLNENGSYTYVANQSNTLKVGEIVKDYFTYTVRDGQLGTDTATLTITVLGDGAINGSAGDDTPIKSNDSSASAPSLVVSKSLLAVAQGTAGTSVKFPIITRLVDTDGSESLSINVSGVPTGVTFNAGTNLGGGIWSFVAADLANLQLNLPGSFSTSASGTALSVSVTSTESNGGDTQTVSSTIRLLADYTTTTATTTENGNTTGSSADNHIQGGSGSNTISGGSGNDLIYGGAGNDTLNGDAGYDVLYGEAGNDTINGGNGSDRISGGADNDSMDGGTGNSVDVFAWTLGDQGTAGTPAEDTIYNFGTSAAGNNTNGGDVLDLRDLLQGESVGAANSAGNLADYLHFEVAGGDTIVHISHTGGFSGDSHTVGAGYTGSAETQKIVLSGVDLQSLYSGATTDQQIITQLLNNNKLITD